MNRTLLLKAIADETRMRIVTLLLQHNLCVRALSKKLEISEAAVSQHLKVLRKAGLLIGEKKGYFMHYDVNRDVLHELAREIDALAKIERETCSPEHGGLRRKEAKKCHNQNKDGYPDKAEEFCHGNSKESKTHTNHCKCRHS